MTGYCLWEVGARCITSGSWDLPKTSPERYIQLRKFLETTDYEVRHAGGAIVSVVYEDVVGFFKGNRAGQTLGGLEAILQVWCTDNGIAFDAVVTTELKRWATGKGNANKQEMREAANKRFGCKVMTHDQADALLLAAFVHENGEWAKAGGPSGDRKRGMPTSKKG